MIRLRLPFRTILEVVEARILTMEDPAVEVALQEEVAMAPAAVARTVVVVAQALVALAAAVVAQTQELEEARQVLLLLPHRYHRNGRKDPTSSHRNLYGT